MNVFFHSPISSAAALVALLLLSGSAATAQADANSRALLEAHNEAREAKGIPPLEWSADLASDAQSWATELAKGPDCTGNHSQLGHGENLYLCFGDCRPSRELMIQAVERWTAEEQWYDDDNAVCSAPPGRSCWHYTQVVSCTSRQLGCGYAECGKGIILVCQYEPPGNVRGRSPFDCRGRTP